MSLLKDITTEKDGESACTVRIGFLIGLVSIIALTAYGVYHEGEFLKNASGWIQSLATYITGGGAAIAYKNTTEKSDGN